MAHVDDQEGLSTITRTSQIIVGALLFGVFLYLMIVLFVVPSNLGQDAARPPGAPAAAAGASTPMLTYLALAFALAGLPMSFLVPRQIVTMTRKQIANGTWKPPAQRGGSPATPVDLGTDTGKLAMLYQTQLIVGAALNEGLAFFASIAYMLERNPIALALAIFLLAVLATRFPTTEKVRAWIDQQSSALLMNRQAG